MNKEQAGPFNKKGGTLFIYWLEMFNEGLH